MPLWDQPCPTIRRHLILHGEMSHMSLSSISTFEFSRPLTNYDPYWQIGETSGVGLWRISWKIGTWMRCIGYRMNSERSVPKGSRLSCLESFQGSKSNKPSNSSMKTTWTESLKATLTVRIHGHSSSPMVDWKCSIAEFDWLARQFSSPRSPSRESPCHQHTPKSRDTP
jgi:hypothetical protein